MPTYDATRTFTAVPSSDDRAGLDQFNYFLRTRPWYQAWFTQHGKDPNQVQLSDAERRDLAGLLASQGFGLTGDYTVDPAGNVGPQQGFAGWPTAAKVAAGAVPFVIGDVLTGGALTPGLGSLVGGGAPAAGGASAGASTVGSLAGAGTLAGGAPAGGLFGSGLAWGSILAPLAQAATGIYGASRQASAAQAAATQQTTAAARAAELQANSAADALAFTKDQARLEAANTANAQLANYGQYAAREGRLSTLGDAVGLGPRVTPPPPTFYTDAAQLPPAGTIGSLTGSSPAPPASTAATAAHPLDRTYIQAQLGQVYARYGVQPTGRGTGPTDIAYMADQVAATGGWQGDNAGYWTDRIGQELQKTARAAQPLRPITPWSGTRVGDLVGSARGPSTPALPAPRVLPLLARDLAPGGAPYVS